MNKDSEEQSNGTSTNLENLESYINASEMYIDVLKMNTDNELYKVGMTAVYYGKAFLYFTETDNIEAIIGSLKEAISAYTTSITFYESLGIAKQFQYSARVILDALKTELNNML